MRQLILSFLIFFCFNKEIKAQSTVSDSLEKVALDYLEKTNQTANENLIENDGSNIHSTVIITYSIPDNRYIICLYGLGLKLCQNTARFTYKIVPIGKTTTMYFINDFISPIQLNEENLRFFLTDKECENDMINRMSQEPVITMLLLDNKFSIIKEFTALDFKSSEEDILCPKSPLSKQRAYIRKKYGHL